MTRELAYFGWECHLRALAAWPGLDLRAAELRALPEGWSVTQVRCPRGVVESVTAERGVLRATWHPPDAAYDPGWRVRRAHEAWTCHPRDLPPEALESPAETRARLDRQHRAQVAARYGLEPTALDAVWGEVHLHLADGVSAYGSPVVALHDEWVRRIATSPELAAVLALPPRPPHPSRRVLRERPECAALAVLAAQAREEIRIAMRVADGHPARPYTPAEEAARAEADRREYETYGWRGRMD